MNRNKWDEFGGGIDDIIQKAINSGNYNSLGRDVNDLIKKATYTFEDALNKGLNEARNRTVKTNLCGNTVEINKSYQDRIRRPDTKNNEIITSKDKDGKETKTEKELKKPLVAEKAGEAGTFEGYTFVRTDTDKAGNVKHVFKKGADTKTPDKKTAVNTGASAGKIILPLLGLSTLGGGVGYLAKRKSKK